MLRSLAIAGLVALALPALAYGQPRELLPGVTYDRQVQFTLHGPVAVHVVTAPRPGGLWSLAPVLSNEQIPGTETLTAIEQRLSPSATVVGVNGDVTASGGRPNGILMRGGILDHKPISGRSSIGVDAAGTLRVDRLTLYGYWAGSRARRTISLVNEPPPAEGISLYTSAWGASTPRQAGTVEAVIRPLPPVAPGPELAGPVVQLSEGGGTPIPPDGAVLVGRGSSAAAVKAEAAVGQGVTVRFVIQPDWSGVAGAIGGGPLLVRGGKAVFRSGELIPADELALRRPRSAVGQRADGTILLATVDGGVAGYSTGMTNFELAQTLVRLGAVTGAALDSGDSAAMAFDGKLLSRPASPAGEGAVADALVVSYAGLYAPPASPAAISPNGDGQAEAETLAYKVVRPSTVTVALVGPDGVARSSATSQAAPGTYPFQWNGLKADGTVEQEGVWRWNVSGTDDLGRSSSAERSFTLDLTLGFPKTAAPALTVPRLKPRPVATFTLSRQASVTVRIETASGVVLKRFKKITAGPGTLTVSWDGVTDSGARVYGGTYLARTTATSPVGTVDLAAPFTVRRVPAKAAG